MFTNTLAHFAPELHIPNGTMDINFFSHWVIFGKYSEK